MTEPTEQPNNRAHRPAIPIVYEAIDMEDAAKYIIERMNRDIMEVMTEQQRYTAALMLAEEIKDHLDKIGQLTHKISQLLDEDTLEAVQENLYDDGINADPVSVIEEIMIDKSLSIERLS